MPISQTDQLFSLIKSLTKAEKRHFKIYARRNQDADSMLFLQLFDTIDKQKTLDEEALAKKSGLENKTQFSNAKRHLYTQIMNALRLLHAQKIPEIKVREHLDFAEVLYGKGLYLQSLKILAKARNLADKWHDDLLFLSIIEFEKKIESRHITRSGVDKSEILLTEAAKRSSEVSKAIRMSNLRILLHGRYIKYGHVKDEKEADLITAYFKQNHPGVATQELSFLERIYLYQAYVWYFYILLDFERCYEYALKWVQIFKEDPSLLDRDPDLYMRAYHYVLTASYNLNNKEAYILHLQELEEFRTNKYKTFNYNSQIISFLYVHLGRLNQHFLAHTFDQGLKEIPRTLKRIRKYANRLDIHRIMVFYYKFSWMHLAAGQPSLAVDYLNKIIQMEVENLREDIQGYARLMFLMAHYDLANYHLMEYLVQSVKSFFERMKDTNKVQKSTLTFFDKVCKSPLGDRKTLFQEFYDELLILSQDRFESRAFIYLEIKVWVYSKIKRMPIKEISCA